MSTDHGIPPPGYSASPRSQVKGPGIRTHTGAGDTVWQPILNLYNIMRKASLTPTGQNTDVQSAIKHDIAMYIKKVSQTIEYAYE